MKDTLIPILALKCTMENDEQQIRKLLTAMHKGKTPAKHFACKEN
ncbi:hypothetical protein [Legionella drancourtii]|uniref:Uncharacterized protein n=1 Tax=Legionella drancourtii LLAP12 TaxID=658187 RepID=G9ET53_9GAMM|nr:hypothetical protein [Legionella drancourtii]EHL29520.1 hypothetical protein LDG_8482 [Legionella drancourtii LLAP12]